MGNRLFVTVGCALAFFCIAGCAQVKQNLATSTRRLGKDAAVIGTLPAQMLAGSVRDLKDDWKKHPVLMTPAAPVACLFHAYKYMSRSAAYFLDVPFYPLYALFGAEPIEIYDTESFPFTLKGYDDATAMINYQAVMGMDFPIAIAGATAYDTANFVESHNPAQNIVAPGVALMSALRQMYYAGLLTPAKYAALLVSLPFSGSSYGEIHDGGLDGYPVKHKRGYNKGFNRLYKDSVVFCTAPAQVVLHAGYDTGQVWKNHKFAGTLFAPVIVPFFTLRHTFLTFFHGADFLYMATAGLADPKPTPFYLYRPGTLEVDPQWEAYCWKQFATYLMIAAQAMAQAQAQQMQAQANSMQYYNPGYASQLRMQAAQLQMQANMMTPLIQQSMIECQKIMADINEKLENYTTRYTAEHYLRYLKGLTAITRHSTLFETDTEMDSMQRELAEIDCQDLKSKDFSIIKHSYKALMDKYMMLRFEPGMEDAVSPQQRETYYLFGAMNELITLIHLPFVDAAYDSLEAIANNDDFPMPAGSATHYNPEEARDVIAKLVRYEYTAEARVRAMGFLLQDMLVQLYEINQIPAAERVL